MPNEISPVNTIEQIAGKLDKYLEIKDSILESDFVEVLGDASSIKGI